MSYDGLTGVGIMRGDGGKPGIEEKGFSKGRRGKGV